MIKIILLSLLMLTACHDSYRYTCQDPDHFNDAECQHPRCEFSQTCPEYLVAPAVEKKIDQTQQPQAEPKAPNCR